MQYKKTAFYFLFAGLALVIAASVFLTTASPANAQCGSQASSCKNCHEVQGQMSVNGDGTGWHQSHAFGDFCYICHAGNQQATEKAAAHEGMVHPLADVKAACQQCHVADLDARAKAYADQLGVEVGSAAPAASTGGDSPAAPIAAAPAAPSIGCNEIVVDDPNMIDYAANYNQIVLGKKPVNWGNATLLVLIGLMVFGGGGFVVTREKLVSVKFGDVKAVEGEYPADVADMLPKIAELKPGTRKALKNVLEHKKAEKALDLMNAVISKDEE
ncbi:MAG: hypothetical protein LDL51_02035 [Chloroflexi bacterium]|nr:hypothetical protein [Chloroflexota bacterium]